MFVLAATLAGGFGALMEPVGRLKPVVSLLGNRDEGASIGLSERDSGCDADPWGSFRRTPVSLLASCADGLTGEG